MTAVPDAVGRYRVRARLDARLRGSVGGSRDAWDEALYSAVQVDSRRPVTLRVFTTPDPALRAHIVDTGSTLPVAQNSTVALPVGTDAGAQAAWWIYTVEIAATLASTLESGGSALPPARERLARLIAVWRAADDVRAAAGTPLDLSPHAIWLIPGGTRWMFAGVVPRPRGADRERPNASAGGVPRAPSPTAVDRRTEVIDAATTAIATLLTSPFEVVAERTAPMRHGSSQRAGLGSAPDSSLSAAAWDALDHALGAALSLERAVRYTTLADLTGALEEITGASPRAGAGDTTTGDFGAHRAPPAPSAPAWPVPAPAPAPAPVPVPAPAPAAALPVYDDHVQFTMYRPETLAPGTWETLLFFAHLDALPLDAPADARHPVEEVARQAEALLGDGHRHRTQVVDSAHTVPREGWLVIVPHARGVEFNPTTAAFQWLEPVHREEFRVRATPAATGTTVRGTVTVFLGSIIMAELPLTLRVAAAATSTNAAVREAARPYRQIFASYSHRDVHVVEEFARYAEALGDRYLRDVVALRSGEVWQEAIGDLIRKADVFQLFWSWHALRSAFVRDEWQYALALGRQAFVRPVYWDDPMPADDHLPTPALRALHFERIRPLSLPPQPPAAASAREMPRPSTLPPASEPPVERSTSTLRGSRSFDVLRHGGAIAAAVLVIALLVPAVTLQLGSDRPAWLDRLNGGASDPMPSSATGDTADAAAEPSPTLPVPAPEPPDPPTAQEPRADASNAPAAAAGPPPEAPDAAAPSAPTQPRTPARPRPSAPPADVRPGMPEPTSEASTRTQPSQPAPSAPAATSSAPSPVWAGALEESETATHAVWLSAGVTYRIAAGCDAGCDGVDLQLRDDAGTLVSQDIQADEVPLLTVRPRRSGVYRIDVVMRVCVAAPCAYTVRIIER